MNEDTNKLAKDIVNGRVAKFYQQHGTDLAPTTKGHMLESATQELESLILKARLDELIDLKKNLAPLPYDEHYYYLINHIAEVYAERKALNTKIGGSDE